MVAASPTNAPGVANEMIRAENVHKSYRRGAECTPVLQGVNLSVKKGECLFLAGPSGSGKSTLLSILGCLLTPDAGRVEILGRELGDLNSAQRTVLRRDHLGFVFQRFQLIRGLTALDNVCLPLTLRGDGAARNPSARRRGRELLEAVGLADKTADDPRRMSAGQCQRVALARALAGKPDLVLADEPTASLDEESGQRVMELLKQLIAREHATAVVVTHDPRIFHFADRICHVDHGRLKEQNQ